jgi:hypothetical protein
LGAFEAFLRPGGNHYLILLNLLASNSIISSILSEIATLSPENAENQ